MRGHRPTQGQRRVSAGSVLGSPHASPERRWRLVQGEGRLPRDVKADRVIGRRRSVRSPRLGRLRLAIGSSAGVRTVTDPAERLRSLRGDTHLAKRLPWIVGRRSGVRGGQLRERGLALGDRALSGRNHEEPQQATGCASTPLTSLIVSTRAGAAPLSCASSQTRQRPARRREDALERGPGCSPSRFDTMLPLKQS